MTPPRDEFLSDEDLDLRNLTDEELLAHWNLWLEQAQATNDRDAAGYSHGVFVREPEPVRLERNSIQEGPGAPFPPEPPGWDPAVP